jgi:hypothetical protein
MLTDWGFVTESFIQFMMVKSTLTLKQKVYRSHPHTIEEPKENIQKEVFSVSQEECQRVNVNFLWRCQECVQNSGKYFHHLL